MDIKEILENEQTYKFLKSAIGKTHNKYKLHFIMDMEDFEQEVYIFLMKRIKNYDESKSTLKTYLPMVVMSCAKRIIQLANGQSKTHNKIDFQNNMLSLEGSFTNSLDNETKLEDIVADNSEDVFSKVLIAEILKSNSLTDNQKLIIKLMSEGYTSSDIAEMLDKSVSCINITFNRCKEKIVKKYA